MKNYALIMILGLGLTLTACGSDTYYIPINNKVGNAKPLSKDDTIRVVLPVRITQNIVKARSNDNDWKNGGDAAQYLMSAKEYTEDRLKELGYHIINIGLHAGGAGHPNVIALVDSGILKTYDQTFTWQVPSSNDPNTGAPTSWDIDGKTVTMHVIYYRVKIVRPIGKDNSLFTCNNSSLSTNLCIALDNPSNYETIFEGYGTMDTNANSPTYILDHLAASVFYQYPNLLGKKRVYQISQPLPQVTKVTDAPPDKK